MSSEKQNKSYRGNTLLKKRGVNIEWTPELLAEYAKCAADPIYFCLKYVKVIHVDHGLVPLELYNYQKDIINSVLSNRFTIVATSHRPSVG